MEKEFRGRPGGPSRFRDKRLAAYLFIYLSMEREDLRDKV